jgi:hypothetical protein
MHPKMGYTKVFWSGLAFVVFIFSSFSFNSFLPNDSFSISDYNEPLDRDNSICKKP